MSASRYPINHHGTLIPGHALHKWRRRSTATQRSLIEAYDESLPVCSEDVHGHPYLHSPTDTILIVVKERGRSILKTVLRDDGDIQLAERGPDNPIPLEPCEVCGNDYFPSRSNECPWCLDTGIVL